MSDNHAKDQAIAQANSIIAMVAAINVDYGRLEELREELASNDGISAQEQVYANGLRAELAELEDAANGCANEDEARDAINNDPLSVEVRSDWVSVGQHNVTPSEFRILLCTGGPAVQIRGELDDSLQPCRAWIEYQDWGTPWMQLCDEIEQNTLLEYCQQFYFGE